MTMGRKSRLTFRSTIFAMARIIARERQVELYPRRLKRTGSPGTKLTLSYYAVRNSTNKLKLEKPLHGHRGFESHPLRQKAN